MRRQAVQMSEATRAMFDVPKQMRETRRIRQMRPLPSNHVVLQRKCACGGQGECDECTRRNGRLQRHAAQGASSAAAPDVVHQALRAPGRQLDGATRRDMESRFGENFGDVRVHTDAGAAESARAVNAHAYTVGRDVVFAAQRYAPHTPQGRRLLAHELTHVVQQRGGAAVQGKLSIGAPGDRFEREADAIADAVTGGTETATVQLRTGFSRGAIQRDLATPPPAVAANAQPDLTPAQITEAINFNRARYNEANTRLIQNLLGGPVTGTWAEDNIVAIAATQEEYGLHKDGKVGHTTFLFLNHEQELEGAATSTDECLVSFMLVGPDPQAFGRDDPTHCRFGSHFRIEAEFSPRCNCDEFQFRQFIAGHWHRTRAGAVTDLPIREPGGVLRDAFIEDTDIADPVPHYGHRADAVGALVEDHYIGENGHDEQAHGCRYRSEDFPGFRPFDDCLAGDRYDLLMRFRGEIQRNRAAVQTKFWTAVDITNWRP
jgi:Domain of unknown function (DUF4157)